MIDLPLMSKYRTDRVSPSRYSAPGKEYLSAMAARVKAEARRANEQGLSNTLWGFATLGAGSASLVGQALVLVDDATAGMQD
jgi:hypothetical protein